MDRVSLRFPVVACLAFLGVVPAGAAERITPPEELVNMVAVSIPDTWTYEVRPSRIIVRPRHPPVFVRYIIDEPRPALGYDIAHLYRVPLNYRIVLRLSELTPADGQALVKENVETLGLLKALERSRHSMFKGRTIFFDYTPEGREQERAHRELMTKLHQLPDGHYAGVSVYVEPTKFEQLAFLNQAAHDEHLAVMATLKNLLHPYSPEPRPAAPDIENVDLGSADPKVPHP